MATPIERTPGSTLRVVRTETAAVIDNSPPPRWLSDTIYMVQAALPLSEWKDKLTELRIDSPSAQCALNLRVADSWRDVPTRSSILELSTDKAFLRICQQGLHYIRTEITIRGNKRVAKAIHAFRTIVFASMCWLLLRENYSVVVLEPMIEELCRSKSQKVRNRVLSGAGYVLSLMNRLSQLGWGQHSDQLLLLWQKPIKWYGRLSDYPASQEYLVQNLALDRHPFQPLRELEGASIIDALKDLVYPKYSEQDVSRILSTATENPQIPCNGWAKLGAEPVVLFRVLHALGQCSIRLNVRAFKHFYCTRTRWTEEGTRESFTIQDIGVIPLVVSAISNAEHNLFMLRSGSQIVEFDGHGPSQTVSIRPDAIAQVQLLEIPLEKNILSDQVTLLLCYWFLGCTDTSEASQTGRLMLPLFQQYVRFQHKRRFEDMSLLCRTSLVEALLQASKYSDINWKREAIDIANTIPGNWKMSLRLQLVQRHSYVLRTLGLTSESDNVIYKCFSFCKSHPELMTPRAVAWTKDLHKTLAQNAYQREELTQARAILQNLDPPHVLLSQLEKQIRLRRMAFWGLLLINLGDYGGAVQCVGYALQNYEFQNEYRQSLVALLGDAYCELEQAENALECIRSELDRIKITKNVSVRSYRNLLVSYVEALVCSGSYRTADSFCSELLDYFESTRITDRPDQQRHVRVSILYARNAHSTAKTGEDLQEALKRWSNVISLIKRYEVLSQHGEDFAAVELSMNYLRADLANQPFPQDDHRTVAAIQNGHCWIRGMGTYWLKFLLSRMSGSIHWGHGIKRPAHMLKKVFIAADNNSGAHCQDACGML